MNCDYDKDMLNIMLRDVFVSGLRDKMILDRLFKEDSVDLEKTLNIALATEKAFKGANDIMDREQGYFADEKANRKPAKQKQVALLDRVEDKNKIPLYELNIHDCVLHEEEPKRPPIMINLKIENKSCSMELDTGEAVSVMSIRNFTKISNKQIKPTNIVFKTYKGDSLIPLGYVTVRAQYKNQKLSLNLYIVKENLDTILGRKWFYKTHLDWPSIEAITAITEQNLNDLLREYKDIFDDKLGEIINYEAKLKLNPGVKPIFCRIRTLCSKMGRIENEIDRLE
ncbi:retrovirus-related Pol polyprotein from transposon 412 [Trichonephila clavata]|uniref:Retrovirus-related Pol polyprotein from transposon 412 n=1 Tax=Trichonephila clavata TaxID=2740835 RepID=A0A8X6HFW7_TRICU|nr:retrovirus-related Pol polyprotein from transposon 412 [Trichonephila clavata]